MSNLINDVKSGVKGVRGMGDVLRGEVLEATDKIFESHPARPSHEADIVSESKNKATADKGRRDIKEMDEMFARKEWARKGAATGVGAGAGAGAADGVPPPATGEFMGHQTATTNISRGPAAYENVTDPSLHSSHPPPADTAHGVSGGFPTSQTGSHPTQATHGTHATPSLQNSHPAQAVHSDQAAHQNPSGSLAQSQGSAAPGVAAPIDATRPVEGTTHPTRHLGEYP